MCRSVLAELLERIERHPPTLLRRRLSILGRKVPLRHGDLRLPAPLRESVRHRLLVLRTIGPTRNRTPVGVFEEGGPLDLKDHTLVLVRAAFPFP